MLGECGTLLPALPPLRTKRPSCRNQDLLLKVPHVVFVPGCIDLDVARQIAATRQVPDILLRRAEFTAEDLPAVLRKKTLSLAQPQPLYEVVVYRRAEVDGAAPWVNDVRMEVEAARHDALILHAPI